MPTEKLVTVSWREGMQFDGLTENGVLVPLDASATHGGHQSGAQPMELLLISLAGCTGMDVLSILQKKRQQVTAFAVAAHGVRRDEHPRIYTDITVSFRVTGRNIDPAAVARSIELSTTKYCPVFAALSQSARMTTLFEIYEG